MHTYAFEAWEQRVTVCENTWQHARACTRLWRAADSHTDLGLLSWLASGHSHAETSTMAWHLTACACLA